MSEYDYEFRRSFRARKLSITVRLDGSVRVSVPFFISKEAAERFVRSKQSWVEKARARIAARPSWDRRLYTKKDFHDNQESARALVLSRLKHFWEIYSAFPQKLPRWSRVTIRDQRSRWGSCSRRGNLNFNYKLVFLPRELQDYIVVHELCHLREFNHSARFWSLVGQAIPDYNEMRQRLAGKIS